MFRLAGEDVPGSPRSLEQTDSSRWHLSMQVIVPALEMGHLALDTNVLLSLHRTPDPGVRQQLLRTFSGMRERLVIPHQVDLEYHQHQKRVRESHRKQVDNSLKQVNLLFDSISEVVTRESRYSRRDEEELRGPTTAVRVARGEVVDFLAATSLAHRYGSTAAEIEAEIETQIQNLIMDRKTPNPTAVQERAWDDDAKARYVRKAPPGWTPEAEGGGNERNGDCFIWQQLITFARGARDKRPIVLITDDRKSNGWFEHRGKIPFGAHHELVDDMRKEAGVEFVAIGLHHVLQYARHRIAVPRSRESAWLEQEHGLDPVRTGLIADYDDEAL
jgi:hypothetical protein